MDKDMVTITVTRAHARALYSAASMQYIEWMEHRKDSTERWIKDAAARNQRAIQAAGLAVREQLGYMGYSILTDLEYQPPISAEVAA